MKAEDLMIGDWVYIKDHPTIAQPMQVKKEHFVRGLVEFEPIPLTPEILEKNGFILDKEIVDCELYESIDNRVTIHNYKVAISSKNKWRVDVDNENYSSIASCELTYVHELQHLLKLCGIEKEIIV